jgi:glutamate-5-semialdehyde dehydrogenase
MMKSEDTQGHIVGEFGTGAGKKAFTHKKLAATSVPFLNL